MKMCEEFCRKLWQQNNWLLHHDTLFYTFFFTSDFWTKSNMIVISHPPYLPDLAPCDCSLFSELKLKLKGRHFDTIEVTEAESQAVLHILTEHNFQDAFKK
jgi:hypothetical protein